LVIDFFVYEFLFFLGVKGFKGIARDLALGVQTQQLWAFQPLQNSQHLNLGITNLVDKASNPLNKEGPQLLSTQCARYSVELKAEKCVVLPNTKYHSKRILKKLFFAPCDRYPADIMEIKENKHNVQDFEKQNARSLTLMGILETKCSLKFLHSLTRPANALEFSGCPVFYVHRTDLWAI